MTWFQQALHLCRNDISKFNDLFLAGPPFWSGEASGHHGQIEWSQAVADYKVTAIETGNALGKDFWVGRVIPWWLCTRPNSLVIVTGPGQTILGSVTWKEVRRAIEGYQYKGVMHKPPIPLGARISTGVKTSPHVVDMGGGWQALGFSTTSVERASGQHADELLVIVEEASGVEQEVWDAIDGLKYTKLIAIGNPIRAMGGFVDLCNEGARDARDGVPAHKAVRHLNTPSTASPHAELEHSPYGLADKPWIDGNARKYGVESLWYRAHVLAIRPTMDSETLIPPEHLDACISDAASLAATTQRRNQKGGTRRIGCDVGEGVGNAQTVVIVRDDMGVLEIHASAFTDAEGAAEIMVRLAQKWGVKEADMSFDAAGNTGKKIKNHLKRLGCGRAHAYFGSDPGGRWTVNQRTASALALARRLDPKHYPGPGKAQQPFHIPPFQQWETMREELEALRTRLKGDKVALENKEEMRDQLGRSPDYADCLTQTYWRAALEGT